MALEYPTNGKREGQTLVILAVILVVELVLIRLISVLKLTISHGPRIRLVLKETRTGAERRSCPNIKNVEKCKSTTVLTEIRSVKETMEWGMTCLLDISGQCG